MKKFTDDQEKDIIKGVVSKELTGMSLSFNFNVQTQMFSYESDGEPGQKLYVFIYYPNDLEDVTKNLKNLTRVNDLMKKIFNKHLITGTMMSKDEGTGSGQFGAPRPVKIIASLRYMIDFTEFKNESEFWKAYKGIEKFDL